MSHQTTRSGRTVLKPLEYWRGEIPERAKDGTILKVSRAASSPPPRKKPARKPVSLRKSSVSPRKSPVSPRKPPKKRPKSRFEREIDEEEEDEDFQDREVAVRDKEVKELPPLLPGWTREEFERMMVAYHECDPTSVHIWRDVSAKLRGSHPPAKCCEQYHHARSWEMKRLQPVKKVQVRKKKEVVQVEETRKGTAVRRRAIRGELRKLDEAARNADALAAVWRKSLAPSSSEDEEDEEDEEERLNRMFPRTTGTMTRRTSSGSVSSPRESLGGLVLHEKDPDDYDAYISRAKKITRGARAQANKTVVVASAPHSKSATPGRKVVNVLRDLTESLARAPVVEEASSSDEGLAPAAGDEEDGESALEDGDSQLLFGRSGARLSGSSSRDWAF